MGGGGGGGEVRILIQDSSSRRSIKSGPKESQNMLLFYSMYLTLLLCL